MSKLGIRSNQSMMQILQKGDRCLSDEDNQILYATYLIYLKKIIDETRKSLILCLLSFNIYEIKFYIKLFI